MNLKWNFFYFRGWRLFFLIVTLLLLLNSTFLLVVKGVIKDISFQATKAILRHNHGYFSWENVFGPPQKPLLWKEKPEGTSSAMFNVPTVAKCTSTRFNVTRVTASYAPLTRITDAINTGVFPGKMYSDCHKNHVCGQKKSEGTSCAIWRSDRCQMLRT